MRFGKATEGTERGEWGEDLLQEFTKGVLAEVVVVVLRPLLNRR
jgi:hypothetical protein